MRTTLLLALLAPTAAHAVDRVVSLDGPYTTIPDAVAAAGDGDLILIDPGEWTADVLIESLDGVVLRGAGEGVTIIRRGEGAEVVELDTDAVNIHFEDLTIDGAGERTGVRLRHDTSATFTRVTFTNGVNTEENHAGGLDVDLSSATVTDCTFTLNAAETGGAIRVRHSGTLVLEDSVVTDNVARKGGGLFVEGESDVTVRTTRFDFNLADEPAENSTGGALHHEEAGSLTIDACVFEGNEALGDGALGGAAYIDDAVASVAASTFVRNTSGRRGGGLAGYTGAEVTITDSTFDSNVAEFGGAIRCTDAKACDVTDSVLVNNVARRGGGIFLYDMAGTSTLRRNELCFNHADGDEDRDGGALLLFIADAILSNSLFLENVAGDDGGAISLQDGSDLTSSNNVYVANEADHAGAAVWVTSFSDSSFASIFNSVFGWHAGVAAVEEDGIFDDALDLAQNHWWENSGGDATVAYGPGAGFEDPGWTYTPGTCDADLWLPLWGGPFVNSGIIDDAFDDLDGSRNDVGLAGGSHADPDLWVDLDGDGSPALYDCDDDDAGVSPLADEICSGRDDDCDGLVDTEDPGLIDALLLYVDADGDGFGAYDDPGALLCPADGLAENADDCFDDDPDRWDPLEWFPDSDGDGVGDPLGSVKGCAAPDGYVAEGTDCDDDDPDVGAEMLWYADGDGDGWGDDDDTVLSCVEPDGYVAVGGDCAPDDPAISPDALWYADADGDGLGDPEVTLAACDLPDGFVEDASDCDDTDPDIGAAVSWYADGDDDGYGDPADAVVACAAPDGYVADGTDCAPADPLYAVERDWYGDGDGDGHGDADDVVRACSPPDGYVADGDDCDDTDPTLVFVRDWYADADGDGYGDPDDVWAECAAPPGYVDNADDCAPVDPDLSPETVWFEDADGDGLGNPESSVMACEEPPGFVRNADDCDDTLADVGAAMAFWPDADGDGYGDPDGEVVVACDAPAGAVPNADDCDDGDADYALIVTWYADADGDGWGDDADTVDACRPPDGYVALGGDCDPADPDVSPDTVWYADADGDGLGDPDSPIVACDPPLDAVRNADDCDDADPDVGGPTPWYADDDGDGFGGGDPVFACLVPDGFVGDGRDCDDADPTLNPTTPWWLDDDGDGWGDAPLPPSCEAPPGGVRVGGDCDDADPDVSPDAVEVCNGVDDDCDDLTDDADDDVDLSAGLDFWRDDDGDGHGHPDGLLRACALPDGHAELDDDCDDTDPTIYPDAPELCDGLDNDCDGEADDDLVDVPWYRDADGDGFGDPDDVRIDCSEPPGYVLDGTDCDDTDPAIRPDALERCNGVDDDCDDVPDDNPVDGVLSWPDDDGDGFGDPSRLLNACAIPDGHVDNDRDCDDTRPEAYPDADELCNGLDDDCDDLADEDTPVDAGEWYPDLDGDGVGAGAPVLACEAPGGHAADGDDCDDGDDGVFPGAPEVCNDRDDDCDDAIDEDLPVSDWYPDADGDGFGASDSAVSDCAPPDGAVDNPDDCDDTNADVNPDATEILDNDVDEDCDGVADTSPTTPGTTDTGDSGGPTGAGTRDPGDVVLDTGFPGGTVDPVDKDAPAGCACSAGDGPSGSWWMLALASLLAGRRRERIGRRARRRTCPHAHVTPRDARPHERVDSTRSRRNPCAY